MAPGVGMGLGRIVFINVPKWSCEGESDGVLVGYSHDIGMGLNISKEGSKGVLLDSIVDNKSLLVVFVNSC